MLKNLKLIIKRSFEIYFLILLILITIISTSYYNYTKNKFNNTYIELVYNIYFQKTLNHIIENLEPKYKKIKHKIKSGETFDKILESYLIEKKEIIKIKKTLKNKINLNKLNTKQIIQFTIDQTNNKIKEFSFQISSTEKINLTRNVANNFFDEEILSIKLDKKIVYKENVIIQSLYKAANDKDIPANIIIEFAGIYGFQVDFQRDIRKQDKFQIMYEIFLNEKNEIIETGEILFANLKT